MDLLIVAGIIFAVYKLFSGKSSGKSNSGRCKYCGGELYETHKPGYSFKCKECRAEFP